MRFVLVEYLTVLGSLTADVMTPGLHSELSNATPTVGDRTRAEVDFRAALEWISDKQLREQVAKNLAGGAKP